MYSHRLGAALGLGAALALSGCALTKVRTDYDREVAFAQLRTYDWVDYSAGTNGAGTNGDEPVISPLLERHVQRAVNQELTRKGFQRVTSSAPDFRISYRVVTEEKARTDYGFGYSPFYGHHLGHGHHGFGHHGFGHHGFGHRGFGPAYGPAFVQEYLESTLILDVFDAHTDELIWRGWARADLAKNPKPEKVQKYVARAVRKILKEFPPLS